MPSKKDLTGQKFGRLTVIRPTDRREVNGAIIWECRCDCGNTHFVPSLSLVSGRTTSCGCYSSEVHSLKLKEIREKSYVDGTSLNAMSAKVRKDNKSGTRGICWNKKQRAWMVRIGFKNERLYLGSYKNLEDAIKARKEAEEKLYKPIIEAHKRDL